MACSFYILFSKSKEKYYMGHTCEQINQRIRKHNSNHKGFTGSEADWKLVFIENFPDKSSAYARERAVKSWKSRKKIEELILKKN
ncbi:GIY-YIG nuclease family protein [Algoriphagus litoralis]|uniref:GIY-YIG nuclease family protein n=1 Tax=Algoriphagus litoralis TaxID=2202829 RepID=UPI000DBA12D1|nr:GIY-YIG nuclease family protein [Algoriphagus litoralis]